MHLFEKWARRCIDLERLPPSTPIPADLWSFSWLFTNQVKGTLLVLLVLESILAAIVASYPLLIGWLVDYLNAHPARDIDLLLVMIIAAALLTTQLLCLLALRVGYHFVFSPRFTNFVRAQLHRYVMRHSMKYFADDFAGRIATKLMDASSSLRNVLRSALQAIWYIIIFAVVITIQLLLVGWWAAAPFLVWLVGYFAILVLFVPRVKRLSRAGSEQRSRVIGRIVDTYTNIQTVKLFARNAQEEAYADQGLKECTAAFVRSSWTFGAMMSLQSLLNWALLLMGFGLVVWQWQNGALPVGVAAAVMYLLLRITDQSGWIMSEVSVIFEELGRVENGAHTVGKPHQIVDQPTAKPLVVTQGEVDFRNMSFHYGQGGGVIEDLNLTIPPGQKIGLVGRSGAGKSTLVSLLLRFYDVERGVITIDGQNIAEVTQESLRAHIAMVTQDNSLMHRSIMENIRYGRPEASDKEVMAAAEKAHAHDFIAGLVDKDGNRGYNALAGERGVKLSGGQRQRIAIARVILRDAPILILDEATSALDSKVEADIQDSLKTLMDGKTVIAIAHRLSTLHIMDRIVVLDHGQVIEDGTHHELLANKGTYAELYQLQAGGFLPA